MKLGFREFAVFRSSNDNQEKDISASFSTSLRIYTPPSQNSSSHLRRKHFAHSYLKKRSIQRFKWSED
jgi:hypothetical protein